jgi:hypothetical protein
MSELKIVRVTGLMTYKNDERALPGGLVCSEDSTFIACSGLPTPFNEQEDVYCLPLGIRAIRS